MSIETQEMPENGSAGKKNRRYSVYEYSENIINAVESNRRFSPISPKIRRRSHGLVTEDNYGLKFLKYTGAQKRYYPKKERVRKNDDELFLRVFLLLQYVNTIRQYSFYVKSNVGRRISAISKLEDDKDIYELLKSIKKTILHESDLLPIFSLEQKRILKKSFRKLITSKIDSFVENQNFWQFFNVHPAVSYFLLAVNFHRLKISSDADLKEIYSEETIAGFVSFLNIVFDSESYKKSVRKRLANIEKNVCSILRYAHKHTEKKSHYVVRFSLGFKPEIIDTLKKNENAATENTNEIDVEEFSLPGGLSTEPTDISKHKYRLQELIDGRDKLFRNFVRNPIMKHISGYIWKLDYCSHRGYYMHVFLFMGRKWEHTFDIRESIGQLWRGSIINNGNGELFAYPGKNYEFNLRDGSKDSDTLLSELEDLFRQDILAYVDTVFPGDESNNHKAKKARAFGKKEMI
ncbi:hypothetical protein [Aeromonas salmonicida]